MPKIVVIKPFKFAHHGYQVEEFEPSQEPVETSSECAEIAIREGWAKKDKKGKSQDDAADNGAAPENKADAASSENKGAAPETA